MNDAQSFVVDCWRTYGEPMPDGSGHGIRSEEVIERGKGEFN